MQPMQQRQAIGFIIDKAPIGGYQLSKIVSLDGELQVEIVAYRTMLSEVVEIENTMKAQLFAEAAWPPAFPRPVQPPALGANAAEAPLDMPKVVADQAAEHAAGLLDRLRNGRASALVPPLFLAGIWLSAVARGLV